MSSLRSKAFTWLLANRNLFKLKLKREADVTIDTDIVELREKTEKAGQTFGKIPKDIEREEIKIGERYAEWLRLQNGPSDQAILYFHGGGYVIGSPQGHRVHVSKFVKAAGCQALVFEYRLAPEHAFPAGLNDAKQAYLHLLESGISPEKIVFCGDSAGAGLLLCTLLALKQDGHALPAGAVALSPWTDMSNSADSWQRNAELDKLTWKESWTVFADYYLAGHDAKDPLVSPLFGDLSHLPPILLFAGGHERMLDDAARFHERALEAGVQSELVVGDGLFHCYPVCSGIFPEATEAMVHIGRFIRARLN